MEQPSAHRDRHVRTLKRKGYQVLAADSVVQAREQWQPHQVSLVVISLVDDPRNGAAFCEEIKERDSDQLIALIFSPDQPLPATDCSTLIFTTEPDEYFLARVEALTAA